MHRFLDALTQGDVTKYKAALKVTFYDSARTLALRAERDLREREAYKAQRPQTDTQQV